MALLRPKSVAVVLGALISSACTILHPGAPGARLMIPNATEHATGQVLTVRVEGRGAGRTVQALFSDIERIGIRVRTADYKEFLQSVDRAAISGSQATSTFTGLVAGPAEVEVKAFDASGALIGASTTFTAVESGVSKVVDVDVFLTDPVPLGVSEGLTLDATILDSPTATGVAASNTLDHIHVRELNDPYDTTGISFRNYYMDGNGYVYAHPSIYAPGGPPGIFDSRQIFQGSWTLLKHVDEVPNYIDIKGNRYCVSGKSVKRFSANEKLLGDCAVPHFIPESWKAMVVDSQDQLWICNGTQVSRFSPTGILLGHVDLGDDAVAVVHDAAHAAVWVALSKSATVVRLSMTGQVLNSLQLGRPGDIVKDIALDSTGNLWAVSYYSGRVAKIDATGRLLGYTKVAPYAAVMTVDRLDHVWVAGGPWEGVDLFRNQSTLSHLSPNGRVLGSRSLIHQSPLSSHFRMDFDPEGNLWMPAGPFHGSNDAVYSGFTKIEL